MTRKNRNSRQKIAIKSGYIRRDADESLVPTITGIDFTPYQEWATSTLGFEFAEPSLLVTALTHRSYVNEHRKTARAHNERLEFLGDAVLELVTTDFLFRNFDMPEGVMTAWRSALVRTESIRDAGESLGYAPLIRMSKGEQAGSEQAKLHIVANCFEALVGAVYLDQGFEAASQIIAKYILVNIDSILEDGSWRDSKSYLQEITQRVDNATPDYRVVEEIGPDHDKTFTVAVYVNGEEKGRGVGSSKQHAQQAAAREAIATYK
ncbi:MAG: ribonuclease III [Candidatus Saccharibacteria bacterium]|nr:ribonuclease III [Candidatus Saccharibacteria bacterium]